MRLIYIFECEELEVGPCAFKYYIKSESILQQKIAFLTAFTISYRFYSRIYISYFLIIQQTKIFDICAFNDQEKRRSEKARDLLVFLGIVLREGC